MDPAKDAPDRITAEHCIRQVRGFLIDVNGFRGEMAHQNDVIDGLKKEVAELRAMRAQDQAKFSEVWAWMQEIEQIRKDRAKANGT